MRLLIPLLFLLLLALVVAVCDFGFKHLLWQFVSRPTAVRIRWAVGLMLWGAIALTVWHGHQYQRYDLEINTVRLSSSRVPKSFEGYRIAQISDLHLNTLDTVRGRTFLREAFDSIVAQHPDIIVFTGDLVTLEAAEALPFRHELAYLAAHGIPVYAILGNHDYADYTSKNAAARRADRRRLIDLETDCGWQLLNNRSIALRRGADSIALVGVENIGEPPFSSYGRLEEAMGGYSAADTTFTVLLSHNPSHWRREVLPHTRIDLTLSGHTHAMQLRFFGWSPAVWKYPEWGGLYIDTPKAEGGGIAAAPHSRYLYVNTGLGSVGLPARIGVGPEISVIELSAQAGDAD